MKFHQCKSLKFETFLSHQALIAYKVISWMIESMSFNYKF